MEKMAGKLYFTELQWKKKGKKTEKVIASRSCQIIPHGQVPKHVAPRSNIHTIRSKSDIPLAMECTAWATL